MKTKWKVYLILLFTGFRFADAQEFPNSHSKSFVITGDTILLDTNFILRGSIQIHTSDTTLTEGVDYAIDYMFGKFIPLRIKEGVSITIRYKTLPLEINKPYYHKSRALINPVYEETKNPFLYQSGLEEQYLFDKNGLQMNGNISRGISIGNNQDVVVNSNLNLQLSGKLGDLDVIAVISDENNPIQPEGNTQQIQDFDKVFIRLEKENNQLTVGDFEMKRPNKSYFMNYYKKSRGAQFAVTIPVKNKLIIKTGGEGAVSRGRFARNTINCIEGNQGPYRLTGTNGETYIVIISGTEAVYIDGERLKRGEQNDYTIDYNSGEITFMPKRLITQYNRIIVEFQYADRNYARSVFHYNLDIETKKYALRFNYFTEQDNKNQPFLQDLNDSNKLTIAAAGDNLSAAFTSGATETTIFTPSKILYKKIDSLGYSIYRYISTAGLDSVFYEVQFNFTGAGKGNYILSPNAANGRVFEWVLPIAGIPQGEYEPIIPLVSPKQNQMLTLGTDIKVMPSMTVSVEYARSIYDKNTYATKDKADDGGNAIKISVNHQSNTSKTGPWTIETNLQLENVDKNFRYIERYRDVEFDRTWNRMINNPSTADTGYEESIVTFKTSANHRTNGNIYYQLGYYHKNKNFTGLQHLLGTSLQFSKNHIDANTEFVQTTENNATNANNTIRNIHLTYARNFLTLLSGVKYDQEQSVFKNAGDSINVGSFGYNQYTFFIKNTDSSALKYQTEYSQREDYIPTTGDNIQTTSGKKLGASLDWQQQNNNRLSAHFVYRTLEVKDTGNTLLQPEQTILTRFEYDYGFLQRVITGNTYFQLGSGNEWRRDYQYLEVLPGQGTYIWKDFNGDEQQSTNEFVVASFADKNQANYIKVYLPTNSSSKVNTNTFSQTLNINPSSVWANRNDFRKTLAKFSNQTGIKLDRKTADLSFGDFTNPFVDLNDTLLISKSVVFRNTLFFNRSNPVYGLDYTYMDNNSKNFSSYGFDYRTRQENTGNLRWNINATIGFQLGLTVGTRKYFSEFYSENDFHYTFQEWKPKITYQVTRNFRLLFIYAYFEGITIPAYGNYTGTNEEKGMELRYSIPKAGAINVKFSSYMVAFNGNISSPLGYDMLSGLVIGENSLWNINYQQLIGNNVQLTFNYDGRKSENGPMVHIGKIEARYLF